MKSHTLFAALLLAGVPALEGITPNAVEVELANLIRNHPQQRRPVMVYDSILNMVARAKALDLANRRYFDHVDPDGYGSNRAVQLAGFQLPGAYGTANDTNYIESLTAGRASAQAAFNAWLASPLHKQHLLAELAGYAAQTRYGIGYAKVAGSVYSDYYVFLSAPPNPVGDCRLEPYAEWLFSYFRPAQLAADNDTSDRDQDGIERLIEFVLGYDPCRADRMPAPRHNRGSGRLEWVLPVRADVGSLLVAVERSPDLTERSWTPAGVQAVNGTYSIPVTGRAGFMRLAARRP